MSSSEPSPQPLRESGLRDKRHKFRHVKFQNHRRKQEISTIIRSLMFLHLLQQTPSIYESNLHNDQQTQAQKLQKTSQSILGNQIIFAQADNLSDAERRLKETRRIDGLLQTRGLGIGEVEINRIQQPLDFIKYPTDQASDVGESIQLKRRHSYKNRHSHGAHQRFKNQPGETRAHHHHQGRSKRHNDIANGGFLDGSADRPMVATKKGLIKGITQKIFTGKFVDAFLGIPFAQPPVGKYRFRHPQPVNPWPGELDASRMSNSCYQVNDTFFGASFVGTSIWNANTPLSEDCLHLNIWTPFGVANTTIPSTQNSFARTSQRPAPGASTNPSVQRPVLVWIFGGSFYSGTSTLSLYEGGALASEEDIIVVSMNYRVSALGFLYFGRHDAPGNAGLFDQLLALQWINDNIDQFGGDPSRVTIFGESAGAVSVAFHLLSPLSRNLFSQAILQSGAATCPWGYMESREIIANGLQLASALNCPSNQSDLDAVIECLLKADPMALVSQDIGQTKSILNFPFVPVVDGSFLLESPIESLSKANFKNARILLGSNNEEGNAFLIYMPEFSLCPSSPGSNGDQGAGQTTLPSSTPSASIILAGVSDTIRDRSELPELKTDTGEELESLESVAPGRQIASANYRQIPNSGSIKELDQIQQQQPVGGTIQRSAAVNQKQQQQLEYLQNDSKPCKPNENLWLSRDDFLRVLKDDLNPYAEHPLGKKAIVFEYSNWNNPQDPLSNYDALDKIVGDYHFTCHVNEFAQKYAQAGNPVYMYYFKQRSSISPWPKWMGVIHGDEIFFVFGEPLNPINNYTQKEIELSRRMMKYWANFAKYGNPTKNGENSTMLEKWPEYADRRQYFELNSNYIRVGRGPRSKQCAFWSNYLPQLIQSYDKSNQCQTGRSSSRIHPFPSTLNQFGHSKNNPHNSEHYSLMTTIPSFLLFSLIVILLIVALVGSFAILTKRTSWKFNLWPGGGTGQSASSSPDNEDDEGGTNRSNRNNNSSIA